MILTSKTRLQAKICALVGASMALATMAASTAAADNLKVFNERVSGVPSANPVAVADNLFTLLTPVDGNGLTNFNSIDGSTWDPFTGTLLFTQESSANGGIIEMGSDFDPNTGAGAGLRTLYGSLGRGGYEGIHPDDSGNIWIVEDVGGTTVMNNGRNPNSFVFRFVPVHAGDLTHGKLQALQVSINGNPVVFVPVDAQHPNGDTRSDNQLRLHTVGSSWPVQWVTIHDTEITGTDPF